MLPRKIDWPVLAQCDLYAVKRHVETEFRKAEEIVRPLSERIFEQRIKNDSNWKLTYKAVCNAYISLFPDFAIEHDTYGGYKLMYRGTESLKANTVLRGKPIGFVKPVPDGVADWSVMRSERTGEQLLLLGPIRFVNSDCTPNSEYDFSSSDGVVQLRTKKRISSGNEILVKYGSDFFDLNQCKCKTCEDLNEITQFLLNEIFHELLPEIVAEVLTERSPMLKKGKPGAPRIRSRQLVVLYNEMVETPAETFDIVQEQNQTVDNSESETCFLHEISNFAPLTQMLPTITTVDNMSRDPHGCTIFQPPRASSPINYSVPLECSVSSIQTTNDYEQDLVGRKKLFPGSDVNLADASLLVELLCSKLHLSDEGSVLTHSVIKSLLPQENVFPSGSSFISKVKANFDDATRVIVGKQEGSFCVLNFRNQIASVLERNFNEILNYSSHRKLYPYSDFNDKFSPIFGITDSNSATLNLIVSTDGVNIKKTTFKKELWPIWIQVADLPPILRMARKNIVLAALFVGSQAPDWTTIVPHLRAELVSNVEVVVHGDYRLSVRLNCISIVADMCAKAHVLNMFQFNGFFGCHYCDV